MIYVYNDHNYDGDGYDVSSHIKVQIKGAIKARVALLIILEMQKLITVHLIIMMLQMLSVKFIFGA